ncbi:MAG: hypothetical protein Q9P01_06420 [Anaerolineae bacterium]|nr:hypothetical protein [Anaerolineae bacterium]
MLIRLINMPLWIFLLILLAIAVLLTLVAIQKKTNRAASIASGLLVSLVTIGLLLGMGEAYYRFVYADSGWGFTLAHKNWESRYWQVNSRGFRDSEWAESDFEGRSTIAVLGDSFASGWGVNNPDDRFPDVLANLLGDDYAVVNLAIPVRVRRNNWNCCKIIHLSNPISCFYNTSSMTLNSPLPV